MTPGIHLVHKPVGPTSFSIVRTYLDRGRAEHPSKQPRVCHGGTLDPFASGLLLMLVQPATRLFDYLHDIPKVYEATVRWGVETDNGDPLGTPTFTGDASHLTAQQLDDALQTFVGWKDQTPPATSAKRIDGERAYEKAHRGEPVMLLPSHVYLHEAKWLRHALPHSSQLRLVVRGGYYVRALARDLGRELRCRAHLSTLHRSAIGPWTDPGEGKSVEVTGGSVLPWAAKRLLSDQDVGDLRKVGSIDRGDLQQRDWQLPAGFPEPNAPVRGFHLGRLCFLLSPEKQRLKLLASLPGGL